MLKLLNIRFILIISIVFILLYSIVSYFLLNNTGQNETNDLLTNKATVIYGKLISNQKLLEFELDELGEAAILFNTPSFNAADYSQLRLSIDGLSKNYQVQFVWVNKLNSAPNEMQLLQANGEIQVDLLSRTPHWDSKIFQLGLRIVPQEHLGLARASGQTVKINSALLSGGSLFNNFSTLAAYWLKYDSWNYRSINHLKTNAYLPFYAQPLIFILIWLLLCTVISLFVFKIKTPNVILFVLFAWLFLDILFLQNSSAKNVWANEVYSSDEKQLPDEDLNKLALQIKSLLGLNNDKKDKIKSHKVLILSSDRYQRARLIYHMLPVNSSFLDKKLEENARTRVAAGDYILSYDVANNPQRPLSGRLQLNDSNIKVKEIAQGANFSIMKVIN